MHKSLKYFYICKFCDSKPFYHVVYFVRHVCMCMCAIHLESAMYRDYLSDIMSCQLSALMTHNPINPVKHTTVSLHGLGLVRVTCRVTVSLHEILWYYSRNTLHPTQESHTNHFLRIYFIHSSTELNLIIKQDLQSINVCKNTKFLFIKGAGK